jgi:hypothetical protein
VTEVSQRKKRAHKYYISYSIVDPSRPECEQAVVVNVFANDASSLVEPTCIGGIIRFHRVQLSVFGPWQKHIFVGSMANTSSDSERGSAVVLCERWADPVTGASASVRRDSFDASQWDFKTSDRSESSFVPDRAAAARLMALHKWAEGQFLGPIQLQRDLHVRSRVARSLYDISRAPAPPAACDTVAAQTDPVAVAGERSYDCVCMLVATEDSRGSGQAGTVSLYVYDGSGPDLYDAEPTAVDGGAPPEPPQPCVSFADPQFSSLAPLVYAGMKNAALFSECSSVKEKRTLDTTLTPSAAVRGPQTHGRGLSAAGSSGPTPSPALYGQLYKISCASDADCAHVTETLKSRPGACLWVRIRGLYARGEPAGGTAGSLCLGELRGDSALAVLLPYYR